MNVFLFLTVGFRCWNLTHQELSVLVLSLEQLCPLAPALPKVYTGIKVKDCIRNRLLFATFLLPMDLLISVQLSQYCCHLLKPSPLPIRIAASTPRCFTAMWQLGTSCSHTHICLCHQAVYIFAILSHLPYRRNALNGLICADVTCSLTHSASSVIWYWPKSSYTLQLGRQKWSWAVVKLLSKKVWFSFNCFIKRFLSEALYEADKALEKSAAALQEYMCLQDGGRSRWWIANVCFILLFCVIWVLTASIFVYVCFVDCCIAANRQVSM